MTAKFNGKWKISGKHNLDVFSRALGYSDEIIEMYGPMEDPTKDIYEEIKVGSKTITFTTYMDGKVVDTMEFELGKEKDLEEAPGAGPMARLKIYFEGDVMICKETKLDKAGKAVASATVKRTVKDNEQREDRVVDGTDVKAWKTMKRL